MHEYPGYLPWHLGGEQTFTWVEVRALLDDVKRKHEEARKEQAKMKQQQGKRR